MTGRCTVLDAGPLLTVQDGGRAGWAHLGVPRSGALDGPAARLADRLVGNAEGAAVLETTLRGCALRCSDSRVIAVTGALAEVRVDERAVDWAMPVYLSAGAILRVGPAQRGVRSYIAVSGGIDVDPVLGSRSTDLLSGLGPPRVSTGDELPLGLPRGAPAAVDIALPPSGARQIVVHLRLGPRDDWFSRAALQALTAEPYEVSQDSDRVGLRLRGAALQRDSDGELPSEGIVLGAVQVPMDGQPLIFLADHPTTGGYPVIAVVEDADLPLLAQAAPGATVRFSQVH